MRKDLRRLCEEICGRICEKFISEVLNLSFDITTKESIIVEEGKIWVMKYIYMDRF